jgi:hypothetical protein
MTITMDNYKELEDVVKIAKENGFRGVLCNICAGGTDVTSPIVVKRRERNIVIKEMERVKSLYPKYFLPVKSMIDWYKYPDHRGSCFWGDEALHYDVSWNRRRCFANNADCSNCGCLAGAMQNPLKMLMHPAEITKLII